jgi:hypothetical protein
VSLERIEITPFALIAGDILQQRRTGQLTLLKNQHRKVLYWSQGELVMSVSSHPADFLADFLVRRSALTPERGAQLSAADPENAVAVFHEMGALDLSSRQTLVREWLAMQFVPLFSLDEGTAAWTEEQALAPEKRVFAQSTAALLVEGIRSITNGLVLRRSLGDLKREIGPTGKSRFDVDSLPFNPNELRIATAFRSAQPIETFLKEHAHDSITAARVLISLLSLGILADVEYQDRAAQVMSFDEMQRDMELLAAIGSNDPKSLRAVALSRQLPSLDHYQLIEVPRAATRTQIVSAGEALKRTYAPAAFPPVVRDAVEAIARRIDQAVHVLSDPGRRAAYDRVLHQPSGRSDASVQQRVTQRTIAEQNLRHARELSIKGDYYGAIVLLKQAVEYAPDLAEAWLLLGSCQERNPKWRREAAESLQMALSLDPNMIDALIALGDVYKSEGLASRAQSCYEDVLKIAPDDQQAKTRLANLKKR